MVDGGSRPIQGRPEPRRVDAPEVVLGTVHERDRHLIGVLLAELRVGIDIAGRVRLADLATDRRDHLDRLVAEMTPRAGEDQDSGRHPQESSTSRVVG